MTITRRGVIQGEVCDDGRLGGAAVWWVCNGAPGTAYGGGAAVSNDRAAQATADVGQCADVATVVVWQTILAPHLT